MEVRSRALAEEAASDQYHYNNTYGHYHQQVLINQPTTIPPKKTTKIFFFFLQEMSDLKNNKSRFWRKIKHETIEMARVTVNMLKGNGSKVSYLFIPAFISLFWLGICFFTTRNPNVTLEDQYIKVKNIHINMKFKALSCNYCR